MQTCYCWLPEEDARKIRMLCSEENVTHSRYVRSVVMHCLTTMCSVPEDQLDTYPMQLVDEQGIHLRYLCGKEAVAALCPAPEHRKLRIEWKDITSTSSSPITPTPKRHRA